MGSDNSKMPPSNRYKLNIFENCVSFIEEAVEKSMAAKQNARAWKFSVLNIVQALELALKEVLRREHPVFIFTDIDNPKHTVNMDLAIKRISALTRTIIAPSDLKIIKDAQNIRNEITHKEVDFSVDEVQHLFGKLIGFLSYFLEHHLSYHLVDNLPHDQYTFILQTQQYSAELESRALSRIEELGLADADVTYCPFCQAKTLVHEGTGKGICYVCRLEEAVEVCPHCKDTFVEYDLKDFSHLLNYDNEGRRYWVVNDYGYKKYKACEDCFPVISADIEHQRLEEHHMDMENEYFAKKGKG